MFLKWRSEICDSLANLLYLCHRFIRFSDEEIHLHHACCLSDVRKRHGRGSERIQRRETEPHSGTVGIAQSKERDPNTVSCRVRRKATHGNHRMSRRQLQLARYRDRGHGCGKMASEERNIGFRAELSRGNGLCLRIALSSSVPRKQISRCICRCSARHSVCAQVCGGLFG